MDGITSQHTENHLHFESIPPDTTHSCSSPVHINREISENSFTEGASRFLDDALSAAMEAIAGAGRFRADELYAVSPIVAPLPAVSLSSNFESTEKSGVDVSSQNTSVTCLFVKEPIECDFKRIDELRKYEEDEKNYTTLNTVSASNNAKYLSCETTNGIAPALQTSLLPASPIFSSTSVLTSWRFCLRPIFEVALVERLWRLGELGSSSPQALLLSIWFIVSRHFGVGCRNDHAKLVFANLDVGLDAATGQRQLRFFRKVDCLFNELEDGTFSRYASCLPDQVVVAQTDRPDRCPVRLFEAYCARRPPAVNFPTSPLYLKPERNTVGNCQLTETEANSTWYSVSGLGKNKIGSMLNFALQSVGMPISGKVSLRRLCDALATSALTPAGGAVGVRLAELTASYKRSHNTTLRGELEFCAEHIVQESVTRGSPINQLLAHLCSAKFLPLRRSRNAPKTGSAPSSFSTPQLTSVSSSNHILSQEAAAVLKPPLVSLDEIKPHITTLNPSCVVGPKIAANEANFPSHETTWGPKPDSSFDTLNTETERLLTQTFHDTHPVSSAHVLRDSVDRSTQPVSWNNQTEVTIHRASELVDNISPLPPTMIIVPSLSNANQVHYQHDSTGMRPSNSTTLVAQPDENFMDPRKPLNLFPESSHMALPKNTSSRLTLTNSTSSQNTLSNDELRVDLRKAGNGPARSVHLELLELLDVVLKVAKVSVSNAGQISGTSAVGDAYAPHQPPVGLITQILWRSRALDDRGPWILTFAMWWMMQHYFGIGSRAHHVHLRWGHLRLVSNVRDPITDELCEAIEYIGPPEFTTVKACALLERCGESETAVRRVYPSSGWAEAEMSIASALLAGSQVGHPKVRPLDTGPDVPPLESRCGPNFVSLFKSFSQRRQQPSLLPEAPFYVQPLKSSPTSLNCSPSVAWFSVGALGKNRIGALMRNIVNRVVRPTLSCIAAAATTSAHKACVAAVQRTAMAISSQEEIDPALDPDEHRRLLISKLSCILCLNVSAETEAEMSSKGNCMPQQPSPRLRLYTLANAQTADPVHASEDQPFFDPDSQFALNVTPHTPTKCCLTQTVPLHNTLFTKTVQLIGSDSTNVWTLPPFQSNVCQTSNWILLTSSDGSTKQLIACEPSLHRPLQIVTQNGMLLIPAANPNHLISSTGPLQNVVTEPCIVPTSLLTKAGGGGIKPEKIAYFTQGSSDVPDPVSLVFLSTNTNDQTNVAAPSSVLVNSICASSDQTQQFYQPQAQIVAVGPNNALSDTADEITFSQQYTRSAVLRSDQTSHVLFSAPSTHIAVSLTSSECSDRLTFPCTMVESASLGYNTPGTFPGFECSDAIMKSERPSPTEDISPPSPLVIQTISSYDRNVNITSTVLQSPEREEDSPPICTESAMYSQCNSQVDATIDNLISLCSGPSRQESEIPSLTHALEDTTFLHAEYGSSHGVFPNTPSKDRTSLNGDENYPLISANPSDLSAMATPSINSLDAKDTCNKRSAMSPSNDHTIKSTACCESMELLPSVSEMTVFSRPPEPRPDQLLTLQEAIDSAQASQCKSFSAYAEQLFRKGILSARRPWNLNFCAWFINSVVFEVENRTDHVSLHWGDFKLHTTADGETEYIYFVNRTNSRRYYLTASSSSPYSLGLDEKTALLMENEPLPVRSPCPVAVFKTLREHRPVSCLQPTSKFYLQPRSTEDIDAISKTVRSNVHDWFTERPWGKNKLGSLFGEAAKMAGLPVICLRKQRTRMHTSDGNIATAPNGRKVDTPAPSSNQAIHQTGASSDSDNPTPQSMCGSTFSLRIEDQSRIDVKRRRV